MCGLLTSQILVPASSAHKTIIYSGQKLCVQCKYRPPCGRDFGSPVQDFAEAYALGDDVSPTVKNHADEQHVKEFLDSLPGQFHVEERAVLPFDVDGAQVTVSGIVDLVHETPDAMEIIDYKTDQTKRGVDEYRKQLSVYYHVLSECFPDKDVTASIFYTATGERKSIEPLGREQLRQLVRAIEAA